MFPPAAKAYVHRLSQATGDLVWSTSSFGASADTSPVELRELSDHLDHCRRTTGAFFSALCFSDTVKNFLAPRVMTTLAVIALFAVAVLVML